ncbi:MAG: hypothetical protein ACYDAR_18195, partial [Thermomicrobiales bacterium]
PSLLLDRFMLADNQPDQVIAAGVLQVDHGDSISPPLNSEQIHDRPRIDARRGTDYSFRQLKSTGGALAR